MRPFEIALSLYGLKEIKGSVHNPKILEFFKAANNSWVKDDETAWCAAFMAYCLEEAGFDSTNKLNARSYLSWGVETKTPKIGDIVVFWRDSINGWQGHVGFYIGETDTTIKTLGGNQSDMVNISEYPKAQLLGYRLVPEKTGSINKENVIKFINETRQSLDKLEEVIKAI